jgi:hypothetical protein
MLRFGRQGWDVAALQFALAKHGFPSGAFDGGFGPHTDAALRRFQRYAHLTRDGVAGPATYAALRRAPGRCPISLRWPSRAPLGDRFGPRGTGFHAGVDLKASYGAPVRAAATGRVRRASWERGRLRPPSRHRARPPRAHVVRAPLANLRPPRSADRRQLEAWSRRGDGTRVRAAPPLRGARTGSGRQPATRPALAPSSASSPPGWRSGTPPGRRPARAPGWRRSSSRPGR